MTFNPQPKQGKQLDQKYLKWLMTLPCCACGREPTEEKPTIYAHQRCLHGGGASFKPPDRQAVPLCSGCHDREHDGSKTFWKVEKKDPAKIVKKLVKLYESINRPA